MKSISREHAEELAMALAKERYHLPNGYAIDWAAETAKLMREYETILTALEPYII